jgi:hypothetical protein
MASLIAESLDNKAVFYAGALLMLFNVVVTIALAHRPRKTP